MPRRPPAVLQQISAVAVGLGVLGLASFAFLSVSGRALGPAAFAPLGTLWVIVNAAGPALFQPLEQEVGRAVAHRRALGTGGRPVYARAALLAAGMVVTTAVVVLLAGPTITEELFSGHGELTVALLIGVCGLGLEHLTRGAMAGGDLYARYGWQLGIDGVLRLAGSLALAVVGVAVAGPYAFVLAAAPFLAVALTVRRLGTATEPGPPAAWGDLTRALGWLLAGSLLSQVVINAAPLAASALASPAEQARAGIFISVLVMARVPLFLFTAVQATFLPGLAALAAQGEHAAFRQRLRQITTGVVVLGLVGTAVVAAIGPWLVTLLYGSEFRSTRLDLVPLAGAATFFMLASVFGQTLISIREYRTTVVGWAAGAVAFAAFLAVPLRLEQRVGLAFLAGTAASALVMGALLRTRTVRVPAATRPAEDVP